MRWKKKQGVLEADKAQKLEEIGFSWAPYATTRTTQNANKTNKVGDSYSVR